MVSIRSLLLPVLLLLVLALGSPLVESQGGGPGSGGGPGAGGGMPRGGERERVLAAEEAQEWGGANATARGRGLERAQDVGLFGKLEWSDGRATSRFVSFGFAQGDVTDFAVGPADDSTAYFARIDVEGFVGEPVATGSVLRALGNETFFAAHANPTALFSYRVRNAVLNLTFTFADGVVATSEGPRSFVVAAPGGAHGHVVLTQAASSTLAADGRSANVTLGPHARLLFLHHAQGAALSSSLHALRDAAASDRVGGMLALVGDANGPVQDRVFLSGVTLRADHAADGRAEIVASSEAPQSRVVVLHLDPASIGLAEGADVTVTLDGVEVPLAAGAAEAFDSTQPLAHVTKGATGVQVVVAIDRFSDRTIGIAAAAEPPTATPATTSTPAGTSTPTATSAQGTPLPWALAIVGLALAGLVRRR